MAAVTPGSGAPRGRLLFAINSLGFLWSHRSALVTAARDAGFEVHVVAGPPADERDRQAAARLAAAGAVVHEIPLHRSAIGALDLVATTWALHQRIVIVRPDLVHLVTPKIVVCGSLAARLARVRGVIVAISGLGYLFAGRDLAARLRAVAARVVYAVALRNPRQVVIVQNPRDQAEIQRLVPASTPFVRFFGSGVDLARFAPSSLPTGTPVVLLAARMLRDKGVPEFVAAAATLRARGVSARFVLCGAPDPGNPASYRTEELLALQANGTVEYWGFREDMAATWREATVACLPSAYGEGLPLALAEAAACGRPIVTTDTPGCRDTVVDGESGVLVPARDADALAAALERLLRDPARLAAMGAASRRLAEARFSIGHVTEGHVAVYNTLLHPQGSSAPSSPTA